MTFWPPADVEDVEPDDEEDSAVRRPGRRASWLNRMIARGARALARGQENAGGGFLPLRRTPRRPRGG